MKRTILLAAIGLVTLGGWAWAQQQELLNHSEDTHIEEMQSTSCSTSSSSSSGGG